VLWRDSADRVKAKGCLIKLFCSTQSWQQVYDVMPGQLSAPPVISTVPRADREWARHDAPKASAAKTR